MTDDFVRWARVKEVFHGALERAPEDRAAFIAAACADDVDVRSAVTRLLSADAQPAGFSASPEWLYRELASVLRDSPQSTVDRSPRLSAGSDFAPGDVIAGRYRVVAFVGSGGLGDVYRTDDLKIGQSTALKVLTSMTAVPFRDVERRLMTEVRLARRVSHPNVCRVYDIGEESGRVFLSMEYIDGEDLSSLLRRIGRLPPDKATDIAHQICAGLAAVHDQGLLHRDLKPANVMIDGQGVARLTDFGLAITQREPGPPKIAGTIQYMAPEQVAGGPMTQATDVYALGLVLYEMFTGRQVFSAATMAERVAVRRDFEPPPPSTFVTGLDSSTEDVILACINPDPTCRPATARSVARVLPGGDLVAEALSAGRVPSPDLLAESDARREPSALLAWTLFVATVVGLLGATALAPIRTLFKPELLLKPPDVLLDRAQEIVAGLKYDTKPAGQVYWFTSLFSYAAQAADNEGGIGAPKAQPGIVLFVYRQSSQPLVAANLFNAVTYRDPPADREGMLDLALDPQARLVRFTAVPPARLVPNTQAADPDWSQLFAFARLDASGFTPTSPTWVPPTPYDVERAWIGMHPSWPGTLVEVDAATFRGRPVYFDIHRPGDDNPLAQAAQPSVGQGVVFATVLLLLAIAWAGAAVLARKHIRLGQGDRRGARRLTLYVTALTAASGLLRANHVWQIRPEYFVLVKIAGWTIFWAGSLFVFYIGFEPLVRRRWPALLSTWAKVLAGRFDHPHVGRDLLVGAVSGTGLLLLQNAEFAFAGWLSRPLPAPLPTLEALRASRYFVATLLFISTDTIVAALVGLFLFVILRVIFANTFAAAVASILLITPVSLVSGAFLSLELPFALLISGLLVLVTLSQGLLASVTALFFFRAFTFLPMTLDTSAWYFGRSLVGLGLLAGVAAYGLATTLTSLRTVRR